MRGGAEPAGMHNAGMGSGDEGGEEGPPTQSESEEGHDPMHHSSYHQQQRHPRHHHHLHFGGPNENGQVVSNLRRYSDSVESISDGISDAGTEKGRWTGDAGVGLPAAWEHQPSR